MSKPLNNEDVEAIISIITRSMEFTIRALGQSVALGDLLVEKGVLSRKEIDESFAATEPAIKKQVEMLFRLREKFE